MELNYIKTQDFYKACDLLYAGHELLAIRDRYEGKNPRAPRPMMIFSPYSTFKDQVIDKDKHSKVCTRSLYNQLKVKFVTARLFEFTNEYGWYDIYTSFVNPPWNPFLLSKF